jgi:O-methyltransferase
MTELGSAIRANYFNDLIPSETSLYLDLLKKTLTGYHCVESSYVEIRLYKGMRFLRKILMAALLERGYKVYKVMPFDAEARTVGKDWPSFSYSMIGLKRLDNLQYCVETALRDGVPGDLIETGVWRGGSCIFMRAVLRAYGVTDRTVIVADSFEGLPTPILKEDHGQDLSDNTYLAVSVEQVQAGFRSFGLLDGQVRFLKGWLEILFEQRTSTSSRFCV